MLLYFYYTKIIKEPVTSFQSPSLNQEHDKNGYNIVH